MKLLLFSDLHRDQAAASRLLQMSSDVDVVVGAGDFATTRRGISDVIDILASVKVPTILVAGNSETTDELRDACTEWPSATVLHGAGREIDGISFWGLGGAVPVTPFGGWSYDLTESEADDQLSQCPSGGVLVTHSPPKGVLDRSSSGQSLGSTAVRQAIERCVPRLVVCGHIHASSGRHTTVGRTVVVNAGPAGVIWELRDESSDSNHSIDHRPSSR